MVKLREDPIVQADMDEFIAGSSDFGFEMRVLKEITDRRLTADHSGHYVDPATKKSREFDIRVRVRHEGVALALSIEAKNLRPNFPVLITCVPRTIDEAFLSHAIIEDPEAPPNRLVGAWALRSRMSQVDRVARNPLYRPGQLVGKSISQVGRTERNDIVSNDAEVYEKWGQATSSLYDLIDQFPDIDSDVERPQRCLAIAIPIVVVPDGRLWAVSYDDNGVLQERPAPVSRVAHYCGITYKSRELGVMAREDYTVSHVEFMTMSGLRAFLDEWVVGDRLQFLVAGR